MTTGYKELIEQLDVAIDSVQRVELMLMISNKARHDDPTGAQRYAEQALELVEREGLHELRARSLYMLGICAITFSDFRRALPMFVEAARMYKDDSDELRHARAMQFVGAVYGELGEGERALRIHRRNIRVYTRCGNEEDMALTWLHIGRIYERKGDLSRALKAFHRVYDIYSATGEPMRISQILNNIGTIYYWLSDFKKALEFFEKSLAFNTPLNRRGRALTTKNLGTIYSVIGQYENAIKHLQSALELYRELGMAVDEAVVLNSLGAVWTGLGDYAQARHCLMSALPVAQKAGHVQLWCNILIHLSQMYTRQRRWDIALRYGQRAEKIAERTQEIHMLYNVCETLGSIYEELKDYTKAYEYLRKQHQVGTEMVGTKAQRGIVTQEFRAELRRLKRERAELRKKGGELERQTQEQAREITAKNMHLMKKQEFMEQLNRRVTEMIRATPPSKTNVLRAVLQELQRNAVPEGEWKRFEERFQQIDEDYLIRLKRRFPVLSRSELKVCLLLKLNLATKEIADLLCVSSRTVDFHRNSIRKKLGIRPDEHVISFLIAV